MTKTDETYFLANGRAEWFKKEINSSIFKGGRDINDADLAVIAENILSDENYFDNTCNLTVTNCEDFWNAVYDELDWGNDYTPIEKPTDTRSEVLNDINNEYLTDVYPEGHSNWTGVFDMSFSPE